MKVAVTSSRDLDPNERWHYVFLCAYRDCNTFAQVLEVAPKVYDLVVDTFHRLLEAVAKMWDIIVEGFKKILPELKEMAILTSPHSPQSFPQRHQKPRAPRKNYLRLNTLGYCPKPMYRARSRC